MTEENLMLPLVSCIMPTCNRRAFVPHAIRYFLNQDYQNKELVIVDDGSDSIADLVPGNEQIKYIRLGKKMTLGEKRNFCVRQSSGDLIMHWDDDDWMAPCRISYQVKELLQHKVEVCGLKEMLFCEAETGNCWLYKYPQDAKTWLAGGSLLYTRSFWTKGPFPDMQVASDTVFIFSRKLESYIALADVNFYVAKIHEKNTSPKKTNNRLWRPVSPDLVKNIVGNDWKIFVDDDQQPPAMTASGNTRKKVAILITTCNRPRLLEKIISDLKKESDQYDLSLFIVDDGKLTNGKKNYWKTINELWKQAKTATFDYYIQLPDDVALEEEFVQRSIQAWNQLDDPRKVCLNLFLDGHRLGKTCWTNFWPQLHWQNRKRYLLTQWVDMFYICEKNFFEQLGWAIQPVSLQRWAYNPELSSGVGQQVSLRLQHKGWHLYQVTEKLAEHVGIVSIMNPEIRKREPLTWSELVPVYAGMASVPEREEQLKKAVTSILPYVDRLFVFLNAYAELPAWLKQNKVVAYLSSHEKTNMGDAGKFYGLNKIADENFYYFSLDDDMLYPPDYTWKMIEKIEKYKRKAIVGCGGYVMKQTVTHFYGDRKEDWHFNVPNKEDRPVHILHTCLTAWHSSALSFKYEHCEKPNMGDVWLALSAQKNNVPMILIERPSNWVKSQPVPMEKTIYGQYRNNCSEQNDVFNSWKEWKLIPVNEKNHVAVSSASTKQFQNT